MRSLAPEHLTWGVLLRAYREFEERVGTLSLGRGSKPQQVRVVLRQLLDERAITPQGKGRGARWIRASSGPTVRARGEW